MGSKEVLDVWSTEGSLMSIVTMEGLHPGEGGREEARRRRRKIRKVVPERIFSSFFSFFPFLGKGVLKKCIGSVSPQHRPL